jgi:drug/metabolite transporter (DMT)-like permease
MPGTKTEILRSDAIVGAAFVLVAAIAFSAKAIFIKLAYAYPVDAITLLALRMLIATPFFVVMAILSSRNSATSRLTRRDWVAIVALGLAGMYLSALLDFIGLQYVTAGMERTILFLYPTFVVVITTMMSGKAIGWRAMLALLLSYSGIVLIAMHEISFGSASNTLLGAGFVLASALSYASYLIGSGHAIHRIGTQRFTAYTMIVACGACMAHFTATHPVASLDLPLRVYELGLGMAVISTILPVILLNAGIRRVGSSKASLIGSIGPVSTVFLAAMFLGEAITMRQLAGTALVLAGVMIITLPEKS